jgi:hypothetical protein
MNSLLRKIIYWGAVLSIYTLMVVVVMRLLLSSDIEHTSSLSLDHIVTVEDGNLQPLLDKVSSSSEISGVLLPLGPDDGHLPGDHGIWRDFKYARQYDSKRADTDGFDGLQAVASISEFSRGAVSELFLAGAPREVFRRGHLLYLLNDKNQLLIIDCKDPAKPRLTGTLKDTAFKHMVMQGSVAYLLMKRPESPTGIMIVVDLKKPGTPRELARVELPDDASSLFFVNSQLVVYTSQRGTVGNNRVYLYDVNDYTRISLRGSEESPYLGEHFLQHDNYVLVPRVSGGLSVYDFSEPLNAEQVAFLQTPVLGRLARYGSMVFATGAGGGLFGVDLKDPAHPVLSTVAEELAHSAFFLEYGNYSYFFTFNGYMQVFDLSTLAFSVPEEPLSMVAGELVALPRGAGFTLLGQNPVSLLERVTGMLPWPEPQKIVDHLVWQGSLIVLDDDGLLNFFQVGENASLAFWQRLQLKTPQRWLAADGRYLYAGGERSLDVFLDNGDETVSLVGQIDLSGKESWDGIVQQKTLFLAAGKDGLLAYSLQRPDSPVAVSSWIAPRHLQGEVDVRHLAVAGAERILFTAGRTGLFSGRIDGDSEFILEGSFRFASSAHALAVHDGMALVATETDVAVVDVREGHSFQNLGEIAYPAVEQIAVAPSNLWAGYAPSTGWHFLSLPRFLRSEDKILLVDDSPTPCPKEDSYRLNLFDDHVVRSVPGLVHLEVCQATQHAAGGSLGH